MNKKNKYMERFQDTLKNPPSEISVYDSDYKDAGKKAKKLRKQRTEAECVVSALAMVNTMTLQGEYLSGEPLSQKERDDVKEFMEWFFDQYDERQDVINAVNANWPWEPRIFRIYENILDEENTQREEEILAGLSKAERRQVDMITDIIWAHRMERHIMVAFADDSWGDAVIPQTIEKKELKTFRHSIRLMVADFLYTGGGMIYRRRDKNGVDIVCGFLAAQDINECHRATSMLPAEVKECYETMPDDNPNPQPDIRYEMIILPADSSNEDNELQENETKRGFSVID